MGASSVLRETWNEFRLIKQYPNQGEILERGAAIKALKCPSGHGYLAWDETQLHYACPSKRCDYAEADEFFSGERETVLPPSGSMYWVEAIDPPKWFLQEMI